MSEFRGTTICAVKRDGITAVAGDGQITMGEKVIMKSSARKVRRIYNDSVIIGFAGSVSDALALSEKFEANLTQYSGNLLKAAVELAQGWRLNREGRSLEALMIAADKDELVLISGSGEVSLPDEGVLAIGSGGNYALAAARALMENTELPAEEIARKALGIASSICVYTNDHIIVEVVS